VIDFRYHLVSIIAVFLALAIGIVVGSTALQPAVESSLHQAQKLLTQRIDKVTQKNTTLGQQVSADQGFAQAAASRLIGHLLTGQSVVLVEAPDSDSQVTSGVIAAVRQAGGTVTGQLSLQPQFFDGSGSTEAKLTQLSQSLAPEAGISLAGQPAVEEIVGQTQAAQLIADAVVARNTPGLAAAQSQAILGGFGQSGYLQVTSQGSGSGTSLPLATMAIVVAPASPPTANDASPANLALIAVAQQLQAASHGTILTGSLPGSGPGSAIAQASGEGKVSTVDNADTPVGQIITVQALWELLAGRSPTSYGVGPDAVPSPAPTPSASPTASAIQHVRRK
jgi:hypothetical protein